MSVESAIACVQEPLDGYNLIQSLVCMLAQQHPRSLSHFGSFSNHLKKLLFFYK